MLSGSQSFGSVFVTLTASSTSMGVAAEDDGGAGLAAVSLAADSALVFSAASLRTSAKDLACGSACPLQLLLEHRGLFAALL